MGGARVAKGLEVRRCLLRLCVCACVCACVCVRAHTRALPADHPAMSPPKKNKKKHIPSVQCGAQLIELTARFFFGKKTYIPVVNEAALTEEHEIVELAEDTAAGLMDDGYYRVPQLCQVFERSHHLVCLCAGVCECMCMYI